MRCREHCVSKRGMIAVILILFLFSNASLFAALKSYGRLINTTVTPDFALGIFPVGVEYEFGITGLDFVPGEETKLLSTLKTELVKRRLTQHPVDGTIITPAQGEKLDYHSFNSEGNINLIQSFYRSPNYDNDFMTISGGFKMHWEQAFSAFSINPSELSSPLFENTTYFPTGAKDYPGTPELNGNGLLVTNSLEFSLDIRDYLATFSYEDGYKITIGMSLAPWYLANRMPLLLDTYSDYVKFNINGKYSVYLMKEEDAAGFTGYLSEILDYQYLSGSAVPRHAQGMSFAGSSIPYYNRILINQLRFTFVSPPLLLDSNHASLVFKWDEGMAFGMINNMADGDLGFDHFGLLGADVKFDIFNMFHFYCSFDYIYDSVKATSGGFKFGIGGYFAYNF